MSQENVEAVRRAYGALNRVLRSGAPRDVDAWLEAFHADVEVFDMPMFPDAQVRRGHDDMRRWIETMLDVFSPGGRWEPEQVTAAGDFVLVSVRGHGFGRESGAPVEARFFQVFEMRDRKAQRVWSDFDEEQALKAAGLSEQDAHADS